MSGVMRRRINSEEDNMPTQSNDGTDVDSESNIAAAAQDGSDTALTSSSGDTLHKVGKQESFFDWLEKTYTHAKDAAAGVLLLLSRECSKSHSSAQLSIVIESIQLFTFALSPLLDSGDLNAATGNIPDSSNIVQTIVFFSDVSNLLIYLLGYEICLYLTVSAVILILSNALYVAYGWSNTFNVLWPIKMLRLQASVLIGLAFIPTIQLLALMFSCSNFDLNCSAWQPLVFVLSAFYILLALAIGSTYFDPILTSDSPHASAHTRITVFNILSKIVLSAVHSVWDINSSLRNSTPAEFSRHAVLMFFASALAYLFIWYQPYYHYRMNALAGATSTTLLWFSCTMFIRWIKVVVSPESDTASLDVSVALVTGVVLVIPLTLFTLEFRKRSLTKKPIYRLKNAYEFELKIRTYLRDHHPLFAEESHRASLVNPLLKDNEVLNKDIDGDPDSSEDESDDDESKPMFSNANQTLDAHEDRNAGHRRRKQDRVLNKVQKLYESAISQYPTSAQLPMFMIYFFKTFFEKEQGVVLSRKAILIAVRRKPWFDLEFGLIKLQSEIKHNVSTGKEVVSFVASEKYEREAKNYDRQSCYHLLEFWNELSVSHPDMSRVQSLAKVVAEYSAKAQAAYLRLTRLQPKQARVLRLYSGFLNDVVNDRTAGQHAMSRAISFDEDRGAHTGDEKSLHKFEPVVVFEISEATQHGSGFGEISYVNSDAAYVLQNVSQKLIGRTVMEYLVPPFSSHLKGIVSMFFLEGKSPLFGKKITTFCISSRKDCFQVTMQLSPYTTDGITFTMFLSFVPDEQSLKDAQFGFGEDIANQGFFLFSKDYEGGRIIAASDAGSFLLEKFTTLLDMHNMLFGSSIDLKDIIEDPELVVDQCLLSGGFVKCQFANLREEFVDELDVIEMKVESFDYEGFSMDKITIRVVTKLAAQLMPSRRGSSDTNGMDSNSIDSDGISEVSDNLEEEGGDKLTYLNTSLALGEANLTKANPKSPGSKSGSSVGSKESAGSQSTVAGMYLRRLLQAEGTGKKMSPQLQRLSVVYVICLMVVLLFSIVYYVIQERNLENFASEVTFLNRAGYRRFNTISLAYCTHLLMLKNLGIVLPETISESYLREELSSNLDSLREIEQIAFSMRDMSTDLQGVYSSKGVQLSVLSNSESSDIHTTMYDATSIIAGAAATLINTPLEEFTIDNVNVHMLLTQIYDTDSYLDIVNRTTFLFQDLAQSEIQSLIPFFWISMGVSSFMQILLLAYFIWPLVKLVERNKMEVLEVLKSIPPKSISTISVRCRKRLLEVHEVANEVLESQLGGNSSWDAERKNNSDKESSKKAAKRSPKKEAELRLVQAAARVQTVENVGATMSIKEVTEEENGGDSGKGFEKSSERKHSDSRTSNFDPNTFVGWVMEDRYEEDDWGEEYIVPPDAFRGCLRVFVRVYLNFLARINNIRSAIRRRRALQQANTSIVVPLERQDTDGRLESRLRHARSDMVAQLKILAKMAVPALAAFIFYVFNYTLGFYLNIGYLLQVPTSVNYSGLRRATLRLLKHILFVYLAGTEMSAGPTYAATLQNVSQTSAMFKHVMHVLFEGSSNNKDTSNGLLQSNNDPLQIVLLLENGCYNWPGDNITVCEEYRHGVVAGGVLDATRQFLQELNEEMNVLAPMNRSESLVNQTILSSTLQELLKLEENFLQVQFTTSVKLYVSEVTSQLTSDRTTRHVILAVYLSMTFGVYFFLVRGIIRSLDNELKRTRRLLLMVPEELYNRLPSLRRFITKEFKIGRKRR